MTSSTAIRTRAQTIESIGSLCTIGCEGRVTVVDFSPRERFSRYLETQGKRLTRERAVIVDMVFASREPFDPEQLVAKLAQRTEGTRVSRSTVYRALTELEKAGLLRKIDPTKDFGA